MKKTILLLLAVIRLSGSAHAQVSFGPEIGLNISSLLYQENNHYSPLADSYPFKLGLKIGGLADIPLSTNFYLQPGIFFSQEGSVIQIPFADKYTLRINYIKVPVNILYKFNDPAPHRFFVGFGVAFASAVGGHYKYDGYQQKLAIGNDLKKDDIRPFDASFSAQIGFQLQSGFVFRALWDLGLNNVATGANTDDFLYNYSVSLSAAYLFGAQHHHADHRKKPGARAESY